MLSISNTIAAKDHTHNFSFPLFAILKEVEFAVGPFTVTPQRETVSDLTYPLSGADKAILLARPKLDTDVAGFVKAFTYEVMSSTCDVLCCLVLACLLLSCFCLTLSCLLLFLIVSCFFSYFALFYLALLSFSCVVLYCLIQSCFRLNPY